MRRFILRWLYVIAGVSLVACQGNSASVAPVPNPAPNFSASAQVPFALTPSSGPTTLALPSSNSFAGAITLPAPTTASSGTISETIAGGASAPTDGVPALSSGRLVLGGRQPLAQVPHSTILYVRLLMTSTLSIPGGPAFSFTIPSGDLTAGASYYVAFFDQQHLDDWNLAFEGPALESGTTLTFSAPPSGTFTFNANTPYWFALIAVTQAAPTPAPTPTATTVASASPSPVASASPSPVPSASPSPVPSASPSPVASASPTPTPTPTPTPAPFALVSSPNPLNINGLGAANAQTVHVHETSYAGTFSQTNTCSGIASVTASNPTGPDADYTATASAAGQCDITFADTRSQTTIVHVIVTNSGFTISSKARQ